MLLFRWSSHPERVNSMKNMSPSELSRRRLRKKSQTEGAQEPDSSPVEEQPAEEPEDDKLEHEGGESEAEDADEMCDGED